MATLQDKSGTIEFVLWPRKVEEHGLPTWILAQVEVKQKKTAIFSATVSVTRDDLAELRKGMQDVIRGESSGFRITTSDDDLVFEISKAASAGDFFVGFWAGEPYVLMKGYQIAVGNKHLNDFYEELEADESAIT